MKSHPKSMYQETKDGMQEKFAMSFDDQYKLEGKGWFGHPEEARQSFARVEVVEEPKKKALADMVESEIVVYAKQFGIKLDKRMKKSNMLKELERLLT